MRYIKLYITLMKLNLAYLVAYRANFYNSILASIVWGVFNVAIMYLLTAKAQTIANWTRDELLLMATVYTMLISIYHLLFSKNFEEFYTLIDQGRLDGILLKPVNPQFLVTAQHIRYAQLLRLLLGGFFMLYLLYFRLEYVPDWWQYVGFSIILLFGVSIIYSIWFMVATIMIWNPRLSNLVELLYNVTSLARYPQEIFRELTFLLLFIIFPLTLVVNIPVKLLVGRDFLEDILWLVVLSFVLFHLSSKFWKRALRAYTSASS